jgi:hypothetical protein
MASLHATRLIEEHRLGFGCRCTALPDPPLDGNRSLTTPSFAHPAI